MGRLFIQESKGINEYIHLLIRVRVVCWSFDNEEEIFGLFYPNRWSSVALINPIGAP